MSAFLFSPKTGVGGLLLASWTPHGLQSAPCFEPIAPYIGFAADNATYSVGLKSNIAALSAFLPPEPVSCPEKEAFLIDAGNIISPSELVKTDQLFTAGLPGAMPLWQLLQSPLSPSITGVQTNGDNGFGTGSAVTHVGFGLASNPGVILHGFIAEAHFLSDVYTGSTITAIGAQFAVPPGDAVIHIAFQEPSVYGNSGCSFTFAGDMLTGYGAEALSEVWSECGIAPTPSTIDNTRLFNIGFTQVNNSGGCCC